MGKDSGIVCPRHEVELALAPAADFGEGDILPLAPAPRVWALRALFPHPPPAGWDTAAPRGSPTPQYLGPGLRKCPVGRIHLRE